MKKILQLGLASLFASVLPSIALAQTAEYSGYTPMFDDSGYAPLDDDPGLLGRHFLEGQFAILRSPDEIRPLDKSIKGYTTTLNMPVGWNKYLPENMGQDVFVSMVSLDYGGSGDFGFGQTSVSADMRQFTVGLNSYLYLTEDIRPFVQTGITHEIVDIAVATPMFSFTDAEIDTRFVINPGVEIDLTEQIAWRSVLEIDSDDASDSSMYRSELIVWPKSWLYLRGGIVGDVEGDTVGGLIGGGIAW